MQPRTRRRLVLAWVAAVTAVLTMAGTANAVVLDDTTLTGAEGTIWDAEGDYTYGTSGGPCTGVDPGGIQEVGYTPADDGENDFSSDAFDGGLYLLVKGDAYGAGVENAPLSSGGHQLAPASELMGGLVVRRQDRALQTSPTLRTLVAFTNPGNQARTASVVWDSAMGADGAEGTRASSSGNPLVHAANDRWIVASDNADSASLGDPPVLFVFSGKRAHTPVRDVIYAPEDDDPVSGVGEACVAVRYSVRVPAHSRRYLLMFTDLGLDNEDAIAQASKYNRRVLRPNLLQGISPNQRELVLNWDLG